MKTKTDTILIIEDDAGLIELMDEKIQECGYSTTCFQTAMDAFDWLKDNTPILMVLDYSLPDMNAREFINILKNKDEVLSPFIVATGQGDERIAVEMMKLGAKEYIIKDGNFLEMLPLITCKSVSEIEKEKKLLLTEQKIIELSQFSKQIIESAHEGIIVYDKELNYLTWNPFMEEITGISAIDIIGKNAIVFFPYLQESGEIENIRRAIEEKEINETEFRFNIYSTGKSGWASQTSGPLFNSEGEVIGAIATIHDVTKRKKAEEDLRFSEEKFRSITEQIDDFICISNINGVIIYASPVAKSMFLYEPEEVIGHHLMEYIDNEYLAYAIKVFKTGIGITNKINNLELKLKKKDGSTFFSELNGTKIEFGNETHTVLTIRDITERKQAEMQINKLNNCFLTFSSNPSENINQLVTVCGELFNGTCAMYNHLQDGILSTIADWNVPDNFDLLINPDSHICKKILIDNAFKVHIIRNLSSKILANVSPNTRRLGLETYIGKSVQFENRSIGSLCVFFDKDYTPSKNEIHLMEIIASAIGVEEERMQVQKVLEESEEKYRTMIEYSNDWIWMLDKSGCFTFMNKTAETATELKMKDWIGKSFISLVLEEDLEMLTNVFHSTINGDVCSYELRFRKIDSTILTILVNTSPIYVQGEIIGVISFGQDITESKKAEKALKTSEALYRNLVQRIPDGVYKSTPDGKFVDINLAMVKMLGYESKEELLNIDIKKELYFEESHRDPNILNPNNEEKSVFELRRKDGSGIWVEDHGWYNFNENGDKISNEGVLRDITERKKAEEELTEKMNELMRFHRLTIGRELTMIELKKEINNLLRMNGEADKYKIVE